MYVSEHLVYLQLQKTACTHIANLLAKTLSGSQIGKHNRIPEVLLSDKKPIIGSIRNPWDWYVSLWAFGCDGKGRLRWRLTKNKFQNLGLKKKPLSALISFLYDLKRPVEQWKNTYQNSKDPKLFKEWLQLLLNSKRKYDIGERYAFSPISNFAGLLTYRYIYLFSNTLNKIYSNKIIKDLSSLKDFDRVNNILHYTIRVESLENDLLRIFELCGIKFDEDKTLNFHSLERTNKSSRVSNYKYYYDNFTAELVRSKEKFIIDKYGYE